MFSRRFRGPVSLCSLLVQILSSPNHSINFLSFHSRRLKFLLIRIFLMPLPSFWECFLILLAICLVFYIFFSIFLKFQYFELPCFRGTYHHLLIDSKPLGFTLLLDYSSFLNSILQTLILLHF